MLVIDIETSGPNVWKNGILSIGAVDFLYPERQFYEECQIRKGASIDEDGLKVNGFSREQIVDNSKKSEKEIVQEFFDWALQSKDHTVAGHNPSFDLFFLQYASEFYHLDFPLAHRTIDLHSICFFHMIKRNINPPISKKRTALNSDLVMEYVGIPAEPKPHNALRGAKWEAEAFSRLLYDKFLLKEFEKYRISWNYEKN